MIGPISNLPKGFLDFFGIRSLGNYPRSVADVIASTLNVEELVVQSNLERWEGQLLINTPVVAGMYAPTNVFFSESQVPQNEFWWVRQWDSVVTLGADATATIDAVVPAYQFQASTNVPQRLFPSHATIPLGSYGAIAGSSTIYPMCAGRVPFFLPAGAQPGFLFTGLGALGATVSGVVTLAFDFTRLRSA